jgi:hypothetical protein
MKEATLRRTTATLAVTLLGSPLVGRTAQAAGGALPAVLDGDPMLVASIGDDLARRGIVTIAPPDAEAVRVRLAREDRGILVDLSDPQGRTAERAVGSPDTAAALIESWSRREIADPLLAPRRPEPPVVQAEAAIPAPPSRWRPTFRLDGRSAGDPENGWWLGVGAGACVRFGPICMGGEGRLARLIAGNNDGHFSVAPQVRSDWQALATAELPIELGRPVLLLGLGVGFGQRLSGTQVTVGPRSEGHATLAMPLWSQLAVEAGVTAVFGRQTVVDMPGARADNELEFGVGLRWGLP